MYYASPYRYYYWTSQRLKSAVIGSLLGIAIISERSGLHLWETSIYIDPSYPIEYIRMFNVDMWHTRARATTSLYVKCSYIEFGMRMTSRSPLMEKSTYTWHKHYMNPTEALAPKPHALNSEVNPFAKFAPKRKPNSPFKRKV